MREVVRLPSLVWQRAPPTGPLNGSSLTEAASAPANGPKRIEAIRLPDPRSVLSEPDAADKVAKLGVMTGSVASAHSLRVARPFSARPSMAKGRVAPSFWDGLHSRLLSASVVVLTRGQGPHPL